MVHTDASDTRSLRETAPGRTGHAAVQHDVQRPGDAHAGHVDERARGARGALGGRVAQHAAQQHAKRVAQVEEQVDLGGRDVPEARQLEVQDLVPARRGAWVSASQATPALLAWLHPLC